MREWFGERLILLDLLGAMLLAALAVWLMYLA